MNNKELVILAGKKQGSGSGSVTSVNGKTGTVVLNAEDVGAEPEKFIVTVTESSGTYSADKTFAEIETAYNAKKTVIVLFPALNDMEFQQSSFHPFDGERGFVEFYGIIPPVDVFPPTIIGVAVGFDGQSDTWYYTEFVPQKQTYVVVPIGAVFVITPADNTIYKYDTLTSLTITNPPATGAYSIVFTSGATATTTTFPATILGLEDFVAEANTMYEINVLDNRAVVGSWAVSA